MAGLFDDFDPLRRIATNQYGVAGRTITKGSLISFQYPKSFATIPNVIHDPRPMLIVTDVWPPYIRGVNLHYLTYPYIKKLLQTWGGNQSFSYSNIKPDKYVALAFRMYYLKGIMRPKRLDSEWLNVVLQSARAFDSGEVEKIRSVIEQQIQSRLQIKASELTSYEQRLREMQMSNRTFNRKVTGIQDALTGGTQRDLVIPDPNLGLQQNDIPTVNEQ
jgi:hypothetical protein